MLELKQGATDNVIPRLLLLLLGVSLASCAPESKWEFRVESSVASPDGSRIAKLVYGGKWAPEGGMYSIFILRRGESLTRDGKGWITNSLGWRDPHAIVDSVHWEGNNRLVVDFVQCGNGLRLNPVLVRSHGIAIKAARCEYATSTAQPGHL